MMKMVRPCWKAAVSSSEGSSWRRRRKGGKVEGLMWYKDLGRHVHGDFSMAIVQANGLLEDHSQIESGSFLSSPSSSSSSSSSTPPSCRGTFVGVYDGHAGPEAARYVADHLFGHLKRFTSEQHGMSADVISKTFSATEEGFISIVRRLWQTKPQLAAVGACCLVGIVCGGLLYIANSGDSRAVLGTSNKSMKDISALQLSVEHNVSIQSTREELQSLHPEDPQIVVLKHGVWRVKGLIQVSRSIGDAYLKNAEFNKEPLLSRFRLPKPFQKPILSAEPSIVTHKVRPQDQFVIFASDGLWEHLSNQEAVDIVSSSPRNGIARKLVNTALQIAAKKREMRYSDLKKIDRGVRRHFHDDITVAILFFDHKLLNKISKRRRSTVSLRGAGVPVGMTN